MYGVICMGGQVAFGDRDFLRGAKHAPRDTSANVGDQPLTLPRRVVF